MLKSKSANRSKSDSDFCLNKMKYNMWKQRLHSVILVSVILKHSPYDLTLLRVPFAVLCTLGTLCVCQEGDELLASSAE